MIMMAFALVLALAAVVLTMLLRDVPERAVASVRETATKSSAGPLIRGESSVKPWREKARALPAPEVPKGEPEACAVGRRAEAGPCS